MSKVLRVEWELDDSLYDEMIGSEDAAAQARRALVLDWLRSGRLSVRRGAELLDMSYQDFLDLLAAYRVPVCDYQDGWLDRELDLLSSK